MALPQRGVAVLVGIGIVLLGLIFQVAAQLPVFLIDPSAVQDPRETSRVAVMLLLPVSMVGLAAAGAVYFKLSGRTRGSLDLVRPRRSDVGWMALGIVLTLTILIAVGVVIERLDIEPPQQALVVLIREDVVLIVYMIAVVWLFNAPAEEFLFRNLIQKRLYDAFSGTGAVVVTSILFAGLHVVTFATVGVDPVAILLPLLGLFGSSLVMGYAYLRTENLLVPIVIHGGYNSVQMLLLLLARVYDPAAAAAIPAISLVVA